MSCLREPCTGLQLRGDEHATSCRSLKVTTNSEDVRRTLTTDASVLAPNEPSRKHNFHLGSRSLVPHSHRASEVCHAAEVHSPKRIQWIETSLARQLSKRRPRTHNPSRIDGELRHHHASGPHGGFAAEARRPIGIAANQLVDGAVEWEPQCLKKGARPGQPR